jgi:hypothetical protein
MLSQAATAPRASEILSDLLEGVREGLAVVLGWAWAQVVAHPLAAGALLVAYLSAEILWRGTHKDPDRPHLRMRVARRSHGAIRRARRDQKAGHQNYFPLPGGLKVAAEFLFVIGGSGTGKTLRILLYLVAYRLVQAQRSLWMIDPKGELYRWTRPLLGFLSGHPIVHVISTLPKHRDGLVSPINPMMDSGERIAYLKTAIPGTDGTGDSFFDNEAQRQAYRVAEAQIAERGGTDLYFVYRALDDPKELDRLAAKHPGVRSVWRGSGVSKGTHHDARATALAVLFALDQPRIARIFRTRGEETGVWETSPTYEERTVGYLCVSAADAKLAPGLIRATTDHVMHRAAQANEKGGPKVDAILEEAGTFGPLEELNTYVNLLRGYGVNIVVVLQAVEQLWARLGQDYADSALSAGGCFVFGRMSSPRSGRWIEDLAGTTRVRKPRSYTPLSAILLGGIMEMVQHALPGGTDTPPSRRPAGGDARQLAARWPAHCTYGFTLDPDLKEGWGARQWARVRLWWSRRWVMRVGQYLVLAHGEDPFLLDTRRRKQLFPLYARRVLGAAYRKKGPGKIRYRSPAPRAVTGGRAREQKKLAGPPRAAEGSRGSGRATASSNRPPLRLPRSSENATTGGQARRNCPGCWRPLPGGTRRCEECGVEAP